MPPSLQKLIFIMQLSLVECLCEHIPQMIQVLFSYLDTCLGFRTLIFVIKAKQSNQSIGIELPIDYFHSAAIFVLSHSNPCNIHLEAGWESSLIPRL